MTVSASKLPRWRGFNLLEKFIVTLMNESFREEDFAITAEWGFDFVRLPLSYWCWSDPQNWRQLKEPILKEIDDAVRMGKEYGIHVNLNFHRAPGFSVDRSAAEPFNLWIDDEALQACVYHWRHFAERYKGIPNEEVSFNLLNEPSVKSLESGEVLGDEDYYRVVKVLVDAIREIDPNRLIIADGLLWGRLPVPSLAELGIAQSNRGYEPMEITHCKAPWVAGSEYWPEATWPLPVDRDAGEIPIPPEIFSLIKVFYNNPVIKEHLQECDFTADWDKNRMYNQMILPWKEVEAMGVGVHVGEFGAYINTPHEVILAWMEDLLDLWKTANWGWAMWNLRGAFGVLDSERKDVAYEDYKGHRLDRKMLELLKTY